MSAFHSKFQKLTKKIRDEAGTQEGSIITEADLKYLPPPVYRYFLVSGLVGKKKISFMRIWHLCLAPEAFQAVVYKRNQYDYPDVSFVAAEKSCVP